MTPIFSSQSGITATAKFCAHAQNSYTGLYKKFWMNLKFYMCSVCCNYELERNSPSDCKVSSIFLFFFFKIENNAQPKFSVVNAQPLEKRM